MTNRTGIPLIKEFEGCVLHAYPDPGTGDEPWTIGYGHTGGVRHGQCITQEQADTLLAQDYDHFEAKVKALVHVPLTDNQLGALVCFAFNVGAANLASSTLLKMVNAGKHAEAAAQFARWNKAAGRVLAGLTKRRAAEAHLYLS